MSTGARTNSCTPVTGAITEQSTCRSRATSNPAEVLPQHGPINPLNAATRKHYFKLLSYLSEEEYSR